MEPTDKSKAAVRPPSRPQGGGGTAEPRGKTHIADEVVSVIARIAAEEVDGVHQIGDSSLRGVFSRLGRHAGIESEVGFKEAAVDVDVIVEYGYPIHEVAETLRQQIIHNVEFMTGRHVVEVNVSVVDVHVPKVTVEKKPARRLE